MTKPLNGGARCGGLLAFDAAVAPTGIQLMSKTARRGDSGAEAL